MPDSVKGFVSEIEQEKVKKTLLFALLEFNPSLPPY
jgi:hypothetical protein